MRRVDLRPLLICVDSGNLSTLCRIVCLNCTESAVESVVTDSFRGNVSMQVSFDRRVQLIPVIGLGPACIASVAFAAILLPLPRTGHQAGGEDALRDCR